MIWPAFGAAEIRRNGYWNRNITESVTATFGWNRKYAESVKIYSFGAKTETEIQSNINFYYYYSILAIRGNLPCDLNLWTFDPKYL